MGFVRADWGVLFIEFASQRRLLSCVCVIAYGSNRLRRVSDMEAVGSLGLTTEGIVVRSPVREVTSYCLYAILRARCAVATKYFRPWSFVRGCSSMFVAGVGGGDVVSR